MKKWKAIVATALATVMLVGCGSGNDSSANNAAGDTSTDSAATAESTESTESSAPTPENPITIRCATLFAEDHPVVIRINDFAQAIEEGTDGAISIRVYPSDALGDSTVAFEEVMRGTIDMTFNAGTSTYSELFLLPLLQYLASNYDEAEVMYAPDSWMHNLIAGVADENNLKFLGFDFVGVGGLGFSKEPQNVAEFGADKGVQIRCAPLDINRLWAEDMGYRTVSIPYSDLYTSLQTGVCDGWSGGQPTVNYLSFRDVLNYYVQDYDFYELNGIYINKDLWNTFSPEQQEVFQQNATDLYYRSFEELKTDTDKYLGLLEEAGIEVTVLTEEERAEIARQTRQVTWPKFVDAMGQDIFNEMFAAYDFLNADEEAKAACGVTTPSTTDASADTATEDTAAQTTEDATAEDTAAQTTEDTTAEAAA